MTWDLIGKHRRTLQPRSLRIEPLESRRLLSVNQFGVEADYTTQLLLEANSGLEAKVEESISKLSTSLAGVLASPLDDHDALVQIVDNQIAVDLVAAGDSAAVLEDLRNLGVQEMTAFERVVSAWVPLDVLASVADLESVRFASAALQPLVNVGLTTSQGDVALNADDARAAFGFDGSGVTVGVLSDSFDSLGGYATDVSTGDLPAGVNVLSDVSGGSDEGRAMAQLIYDVAPGADLTFHTAFNGVADFAQGIIDLANAGADVIVDDIIYYAEPMFQDGIIAQAIDTVVAGGVSYFSAAGNNSRDSYESSFVDSGTDLLVNNVSQGVLHDFDPGPGVDVLQSITIPTGDSLTISFQWDQPYFSAGGSGSASDYDVYLVKDNTIIAQSIDNNIGNDPVEILSFQNDGQYGSSQFELLITRYSGPDAGLMKYVRFESSGVSVDEYDTASSTSYGHSNAAGAQSVGAARYSNTPEFGTDPALLESYSSAGGVPILFDAAGNLLATPEVRANPAIVAPDGTNTTFFGFDIVGDVDAYPNFFGTSAAAPHAAAVAALVLDANPNLAPQELYDLLQDTAQDMGSAGFDYNSGYGLIDAFSAVANANIGDTDLDGDVDADDIDYLFANLGSSSIQFDIDRDGGIADKDDVNELVHIILGTEFGDANLDGKINLLDFSALSDSFFGAGGWAQGDFNGDLVVNFLDFSLLSHKFGFQSGSLVEVTEELQIVSLIETSGDSMEAVSSGVALGIHTEERSGSSCPERLPQQTVVPSSKVSLKHGDEALSPDRSRRAGALLSEATPLEREWKANWHKAIDAALEDQVCTPFK